MSDAMNGKTVFITAYRSTIFAATDPTLEGVTGGYFSPKSNEKNPSIIL